MAKDTPAKQPSIEERVNSLVDSMVKNDDGKWDFPEDVDADEGILFAAKAERRRRDTQAEYSRGQQALKAAEAERDRVLTAWEADALSKMSDEQREELETLKHEDPDQWRTKLAQYEEANRNAFKDKYNGIKEEAHKETELERRTRLLEEYNEANPYLQLTDDVIDNDLPPRFVKQLESGELAFEEFISKSAEFLGKGKVIEPGSKAPEEPNLGKAPGGSTPTEEAVEQSVTETYKDEIY